MIFNLLILVFLYISSIILIILSLLINLFSLLVCCIFNENSKACIFKNSLKSFCKRRKALVSKEDYEKAQKIVKEYETQN